MPHYGAVVHATGSATTAAASSGATCRPTHARTRCSAFPQRPDNRAGPLEPFDDSVPETLKENGVYTHLATDHQHYWLDGSATYHPRYSTFEFFRGQEGDERKGHVADPVVPDSVPHSANPLRRQDWVNRLYLKDEADHPQR
ncbi:hypothetical protein [Actinomadura bangladeshensis]|uniref:Uncharacterized protein n=1 Tax=Actinomadura bangladeshensis TaxID=453573 RepID=A0A6L9Q8F6_9ACTN|nr:hypothetical protein [Actinomadura bangladeshensis]NEA21697.1 hypothetical protein [Actinomadura bangladeshensis]